jgi:hypothetical protein
LIFSSLHIFILPLFIEHTLVCLNARWISSSYNVISLPPSFFFFLLIAIHYSHAYTYCTILNKRFFSFFILRIHCEDFFVCSLSLLQGSLQLNNREREWDVRQLHIDVCCYICIDRYEKWQTYSAMHSALYYQFNLMLWLAACLSSDDIRSSNCLHITFVNEVPGKYCHREQENEWALDEKQ